MVKTSEVTGQSSGQVMRRKVVQRVGVVERGRLVDLGRDGAQAGEEQQDREAGGPPDRHQATAGMNQSRDLKTGTRGMPSQSSTCMAMPNWKFSVQSQIR